MEQLLWCLQSSMEQVPNHNENENENPKECLISIRVNLVLNQLKNPWVAPPYHTLILLVVYTRCLYDVVSLHKIVQDDYLSPSRIWSYELFEYMYWVFLVRLTKLWLLSLLCHGQPVIGYEICLPTAVPMSPII